MNTPHIALDFTSLDELNIANGLYRYVVELVQGLVRVPVPARFTLLGSRQAPVPELADIIACDERWNYVQMKHVGGRGGYLIDQFRYPRLCARLGVDLLHAPHTFLPLFAGCRTVVTEHDLMFDLFDEYRANRKCRQHRLYRLAARRAQRVIAISQTTADDLVRLHGMERQRIDVVYHGSTFCGAPPVNRSGASGLPFLLSPYNLEPRKNIGRLLSAFALLREEFPDLQLRLFGRAASTAEREKEFETLLQKESLDSSVVERIGFVSDDELRRLYQTCRLFVFPSLYEGFGLPLLEAMASSSCVVARHASAMAEVVGSAGVLVDTTDPRALAQGIRSILRNTSLETSLRWAAYRRAQQFTIERMATQTLCSYYSALDLPLPVVLAQTFLPEKVFEMKPALPCTTT